MVAIRQLGCSLNEIYCALHPGNLRNGEQPALFAVSRGVVYNERPFLSFLIKIYYFVIRIVFGRPVVPPVGEALRFILNNYFNQVVDVAYQGRQRRIIHYVRSLTVQPSSCQELRYADFLREELRGSVRESHRDRFLEDFHHIVEPLSEASLINLTNISATFETHIARFWRECVRGDEASRGLVDVLRPYLRNENQSRLTDKALFDAIAKENSWGHLEGIMNRRIPVALLSKLHDPTTLTIDERTTLQNWVVRMNQSRVRVSAEMLTTVLDELAQIISIAGSHPTTFEDIVFWLHQQGCEVLDLNARDVDFVRSRRSLRQSGQIITYFGQNYTLGREIPENTEPGTYEVFEIQENRNLVVKFPINRFVYPIYIKEREIASSGSIFPFSKVMAFDPNRGFLIQEKLASSFSDHQWTSSSEELNPEDRSLAFGFAKMIVCLNDWRESFENFALSDIKLTAEGDFRVDRRFERGGASYTRLEDYCVRAAAGNRFVLRYLMQVSKLHEETSAHYYRYIITDTLQGKISKNNFPVPNQDEIDEEYARGLHQQALNLRADAICKVESVLYRDENFRKDRLNDIPAMVSARLVELYNQSPASGHLEADLLERVVDSFRQPVQGKSGLKAPYLSKSGFVSVDKYYEKERLQLWSELRQQAVAQASLSSSSSSPGNSAKTC